MPRVTAPAPTAVRAEFFVNLYVTCTGALIFGRKIFQNEQVAHQARLTARVGPNGSDAPYRRTFTLRVPIGIRASVFAPDAPSEVTILADA
jgi:hypothetical protein